MSTRTTQASGSVRWLDNDPVTGNKMLRITSQTKAGPVVQDYEVEPIKPGIWRLWRLDPRTFTLVHYNVRITSHPDTSRCTCPDAQHRGGGCGCKHARGLWAALDSLPF